MNIHILVIAVVLGILTSFKTVVSGAPAIPVVADTLAYPEETHLKNIQQLSFGGDNAEAYFSFDGKYLVFQKTNPKEGIMCDQIFIGKVPEKPGDIFMPKLVSTGKGRTTCGFFTKDGRHVVYGSTHLGGDECPPVPDRAKYGNRYIWPLYKSMDIFMADTSGKIVKQMTNTPGYDAEATLSPDGRKMVFTSVRDGDLELYIMDMKSGNTKRITHDLGYDGGAWFSPDGKRLIWRASRPETPEEIKEYKELLAEGLVAPTRMEVYTSDLEGKNLTKETALGQANWAPNFMPDSKRIIFASNHEYKRGFPFNMYILNPNGKIDKVSRDQGFDAFPMFSPNGRKIVFCSNRNNGGTRDTNIFVADWQE
jgi:Tol biopolymer transport system component